jgi:hypothetical protein
MYGPKDVPIGLTHHGTPPKRVMTAGTPPNDVQVGREPIEVFGHNHDAATYRHWRNEGLTPTTDVRFDFEGAFKEATANARVIHFNLDGFRLEEAWQLGQNADPYVAKVTNWEFVKVLRDPDLRQKSIFWQNGKRVPLSRVLERAGVPPNAIPWPNAPRILAALPSVI